MKSIEDIRFEKYVTKRQYKSIREDPLKIQPLLYRLNIQNYFSQRVVNELDTLSLSAVKDNTLDIFKKEIKVYFEYIGRRLLYMYPMCLFNYLKTFLVQYFNYSCFLYVAGALRYILCLPWVFLFWPNGLMD